MKFGFGPEVLEKKIFENGWWIDDSGQWIDEGTYPYYKLTNEPKGSGELIIETMSGTNC